FTAWGLPVDPEPLSLSAAQASIVLAALSGSMFEIGDDLLALSSEPERLALITNANLLQMVKLGKPAKPLDLMSFLPEDEQPSVFLLSEDERQSMLAVFNWTKAPRTHTFSLADLHLKSDHVYHLFDALNGDQPISFNGHAVQLSEQRAES